jgi:hypothetical protein
MKAERIGAMRVWAPDGGAALGAILGGLADPAWLLTRRDCEIVKYDGKVWVGRVRGPAGPVYVKHYVRSAVRTALDVWLRGSPGRRAALAAARLASAGFPVPQVCAGVEVARAGVTTKSFFLSHEVPEACTIDRWWTRLAVAAPAEKRAGRRALAAAVGTLFARLHAAGVYHNDLKDVNVLASGPPLAPALTLLDLEDVRFGAGPLGRRRRVKNLVQLDRTLGPRATRSARLRLLHAYLGPAIDREAVRDWVADVLGARARKERRRVAGGEPDAPAAVSCAVVCQDEAAMIAPCLAGVRWCGEIVVVDGGSRDDTVAIARAAGARVIEHAWPGYRAQKQFALDHTTLPWVLSVDADERVTPELAQALRRLVAVLPADVSGVAIARLVPYLGRWWFRGGWYPRPMPRLVRRGKARWGGVDPHDRLEVEGRVVRLRTPLLHYTYADMGDHVRSVGRLTAAAVGQIPRARRVGAGRLVVEPCWRFFRSWVVKRGVLEGSAGLFVAATDAFYVFLRWASVWARRREAV